MKHLAAQNIDISSNSEKIDDEDYEANSQEENYIERMEPKERSKRAEEK